MVNNYSSFLGDLADASKYQENIDISGFKKDELLTFLSKMTTIRTAEMAIAQLVLDDQAKCPCHLTVGQEAIATGISTSINKDDYVFGNHRSHGHYLSLGSDLNALMAEVLGKKTGCSGGMGGSMHLISEETGFMGSVPIVGGTIPIATGAALAAKMRGEGQIAISYFGDGAAEEGGIHESMNLAVVHKLPILFVCENNLYSSHLDISLRQPSDAVSRYAKAHCINFEVIDGNNVALVAKKASELIQGIREGNGPAFLEAVTYRWFGHVGPDANIDVGVRRSEKEVNMWKKREPIRRLKDSILISEIASKDELEGIEVEIQDKINKAVTKAIEAPYPDENSLMDLVYSENR